MAKRKNDNDIFYGFVLNDCDCRRVAKPIRERKDEKPSFG